MADEAAKEAATRNRIITHMNNDHQDSLIRYLEHFHAVSSFGARNAHLEDVTSSSMSIKASGRRYDIPIKPTLAAWSEIRPRVVAMDAEAIAGLGRSHVSVKKYVRPYGFMLVVFIGALLFLVSFAKRSNFEPGSLLNDNLLRHVPLLLANFCWQVQPLIFYPILILHLGEAVYMASSRLSTHTVPMGGQLWLTWVCGTFIEGYGSFVRFDALVKEEELRRANAKH